MHLNFGLAEGLYRERYQQSDTQVYLILANLYHNLSEYGSLRGLLPPMLLGTMPRSAERRRLRPWVAMPPCDVLYLPLKFVPMILYIGLTI
ncbi:hypothetical protein TNCV_4413021 [Trichonephila clavipes]|nr:hypothetical protein TNCV_4413021 [Trichonephila clavipes]